MKRLLFVLAAAVLLVAGCVQQPPGDGGNGGNQTENAVRISGFQFIPQTITIQKGEAVTWTNEDSAPHDIASNPHPVHTDLPGLRSGELQKGQSYTFTFDQAGSWGYHCHLHPTMTGTVIVQE